MRPASIRNGLLLVCMIFASPVAHATVCDPTKTIGDCYEKILAAEGWKDESAAEESKQLAVKETGSVASNKPSASAIKDFIPLFAASADNGDLAGEEANLTLAFNRFLGLSVDDGYRLEATLNRATVFDPLQQAFGAAQLSSRIDELEKQLDDFSDVGYLFAWSPMSGKLGRNFNVHAEEYSQLFEAVLSNVRSASKVHIDQLVMQAYFKTILAQTQENARKRLGDPTYQVTSMTEVVLLDVPDQDQLESVIQGSAAGLAEYRAAVEKATEKAQFFGFSDLINNQPQLVFQIGGNARDELAGPDSVEAKITYEIGWANVNSYKKECGSQVGNDALFCYTGYYRRHRQDIVKGDRLAVSVAYSRKQAYRVAFPSDAIALDLQSERALTASLTYGRYFGEIAADNQPKSRVDVTGEYENHGNDPTRQSRAILTAIMSRKIADGIALQLGMTWANHPEFVGESDRRLSTHVGLSYKFLRDEGVKGKE
jgi:hypothetical protein